MVNLEHSCSWNRSDEQCQKAVGRSPTSDLTTLRVNWLHHTLQIQRPRLDGWSGMIKWESCPFPTWENCEIWGNRAKCPIFIPSLSYFRTNCWIHTWYSDPRETHKLWAKLWALWKVYWPSSGFPKCSEHAGKLEICFFGDFMKDSWSIYPLVN